MSEITREAGIASGTFYLYFPSKAHLEATLIERFVDGYVAAVEAAVSEPGPLAERLSRTIASLVRYPTAHEAVFRLQVTHTPTPETREIIGNGISRLRGVLAGAMQQGAASGEMTLPDPEMTAALVFHGVEGMLRDSVALSQDLDEDRLIAGASHCVAAHISEGVRTAST